LARINSQFTKGNRLEGILSRRGIKAVAFRALPRF